MHNVYCSQLADHAKRGSKEYKDSDHHSFEAEGGYQFQQSRAFHIYINVYVFVCAYIQAYNHGYP